MSQNIFLTANIVLIVVCILIPLFFLFIPIPQKKGLKNYRISLRILSLAYFALSVLIFLTVLYGNNEIDYVMNFTAISLQTILFAFSLIVLLNPDFSNTHLVLKHLTPTFILVVLSVLFKIIWKYQPLHTITEFIHHANQPSTVVVLLFFLFCIVQLVYFFRLFHLQLKKYEAKIDDYYADTYPLKLHWVSYCFYAATVFCVLVIISMLIPNPLFGIIVTAINSVFYLVFGLCYIQYPSIYHILEPALSTSMLSPNIDEPITVKVLSWEKLKSKIISEKFYLRSEINIEEMAQYLKIGRTTLSNFINKEENVNFHTWISQLRINEAQQLFLQDTNVSIKQMANNVGYSELSHFSRQFKQITGYSPSVWRDMQARES
jgi:AraC-like DNA-binding protein